VTETPLSIAIDRSSPVPLYFQVAQELERRITTGEIAVGTRLENELLLAERLGLSRPTLRRSIEYLVDRGLLVRKRGVGTQVVMPRVRRPLQLSSLHDDLTRAGEHPRTEVLRLAVETPPDAIATSLEIAPDTEVYVIERLRYTGDEPLALMHNYVPVNLLRLDEETLAHQGLYQLLRAAGVSLKLASQSIGARNATAAEARVLDESRGAPLLTMDRTVYDDVGTVVEVGSHVYRASRHSFELTLTD
jgi:DNA-binding GntR family transcriptional regulator